MSEPKAAAATAAVADPFLTSMTFTTGVQRDCDCDECGMCVGLEAQGGAANVGAPAKPSGGGGGVPPDVAAYIREHKRAKLAAGAVARRQERVLVARAGGGGASVYRLTMPPGAEPLIEFGNSHRIVVVDRLSSSSRVKSIGKGIVGSSDEEKGRETVHWEEGKAYLVPSNGGRALGWTNETVEKKDGAGKSVSGSNMVLFMVKVTPEAMEAIPDDKEFTDGWVRDVLRVFRQNLNLCKEGKDMEQDPKEGSRIASLSESDHEALANVLPPLLEAKGL